MRVLQRIDRAVLLDHLVPPAVQVAYHHIVHIKDPPVSGARERLVQLRPNLFEVHGRKRAEHSLYLKKQFRQILGLSRREIELLFPAVCAVTSPSAHVGWDGERGGKAAMASVAPRHRPAGDPRA